MLARRVAAAEGIAIMALAALAIALAGPAWLVPVALAAPLVAIELWFDVRSRGRRLVPELCGAIGIASLAASVALAGGAPVVVAAVAWLILAARSVAAIPYVRTQVLRLHRSERASGPGGVLTAQAAGLVGPASQWPSCPPRSPARWHWPPRRSSASSGCAGRPAPPPGCGALESALGLVVVVATAVGLHLGGAA